MGRFVSKIRESVRPYIYLRLSLPPGLPLTAHARARRRVLCTHQASYALRITHYRLRNTQQPTFLTLM